MEVWKPIKGYETYYEVSNYGNVRNLKTGYVMKKRHTYDGYVKVTLTVNYKAKDFRVHRLVAETFIPNEHNKETVNHIDGNKDNNNVNNLEWADRHEQLEHAYKLGLKKPDRGCDNCNSKFTAEQVRYIKKHYIPQSKEYGTVALGKKFGVNNSTIGDIVRGVTYKDIV